MSLSVFLSICLSTCLSICLSVCLSAYVSLSFCQSVCWSVCLSICLSICLSFYLLVCLSICLFQPLYLSVGLSTSLSVCLPVYLLVCLSVCFSVCPPPSSCPSFDLFVRMPASFLVWVARHMIIIRGTTYTTVQHHQAWILMFQAVRSKLPPSSPASPPVADTTLPPEKEKKLRNLKKVKYHLIPQPTQQNTKSLKCVLCCQLIKKNTFNKKFEQTHHQKWESINQ